MKALDELEDLERAAIEEHAADLERRAVAFDGGLGLLAVAACLESPPGPERDLEIATWARRLAETPNGLAVIIYDDMPADEVDVITALAHRMHSERAGRTS